MKIKTILISAVLVVGAGAATSYFVRSASEKNVKQIEVVPVVSVNSAEYSMGDSGTVSGTIISKDTQVVTLDSGHELVGVYVQTGDRVKKGDKLLEYDMLGDELKAEMEELTKLGLELNLEAQKKDLEIMRSGRMPESMSDGDVGGSSDDDDEGISSDDEEDDSGSDEVPVNSKSAAPRKQRQGGGMVGAADTLAGAFSGGPALISATASPLYSRTALGRTVREHLSYEDLLRALRERRQQASEEGASSGIIGSDDAGADDSLTEDDGQIIIDEDFAYLFDENGNFIGDAHDLEMLFLAMEGAGSSSEDTIPAGGKLFSSSDDEADEDYTSGSADKVPNGLFNEDEVTPLLISDGSTADGAGLPGNEENTGAGLIISDIENDENTVEALPGNEKLISAEAAEPLPGNEAGGNAGLITSDNENDAGTVEALPGNEEVNGAEAAEAQSGDEIGENAEPKLPEETSGDTDGASSENGEENSTGTDGTQSGGDGSASGDGSQVKAAEAESDNPLVEPDTEYAPESVLQQESAPPQETAEYVPETNFDGDLLVDDVEEEVTDIIAQVNSFLSTVNAVTLAVDGGWDRVESQMATIDAAIKTFREMFAQVDERQKDDLFGDTVTVKVYSVSEDVRRRVGDATAQVLQTAYDRLCAYHFINTVLQLNPDMSASSELDENWSRDYEEALRAAVIEYASLPDSMFVYNPAIGGFEFSSQYAALNGGVFSGESIMDFLKSGVQTLNTDYVMQEPTGEIPEYSTEGKMMPLNPSGKDSDEEDPGFTAEELAEAIKEQEKAIKETELQIREAELGMKEYQQVLDGKIVYATMDGIVKSAGTMESSSGHSFITITGREGLYVKGTVNELSLDTVKVGDIITGTSYENGSTFTAEIVEISDYPEDASSSYYYGFGDENTNSSYYPFLAYIENAEGLEVDSYVDLSFTGVANAGTSDPVFSGGLSLEEYFIRTDGNGRSYCYVRGKDGLLEKRYLEVGANNWGVITVKSGLAQDDYIAFPYGDGVEEGAQTVEVEYLSAVDGETY